ncbi:hypothetical protein VTI74DRAFT_2209 [Chaetomium olivicolor]
MAAAGNGSPCHFQVSMSAKTFQLVRWWTREVHGASFWHEAPHSVISAVFFKSAGFLSVLSRPLPVLASPTRAFQKTQISPTNFPHRWKCFHHRTNHHHHHHRWCFPNMALLAAPRTASSKSLSQKSDVISTLYPLINTAVQFQQLVGSAAFHLFVRTYFAATILATTSLWASKGIAWRALIASRIIAARTLVLMKNLAWTAWDCKRSRRFRKRLEFELFALLLGPGGNAMLLMLFWPGWLMLALLGWGIWQLTG